MDVRFNSWDIDTNAIKVIIDQLSPYLKYDPKERFRVLDVEKASEKQWIFYEQIFVPFITEYHDHFEYHHNDYQTDTWCGEQVCLSMVHYLNQKAWWLLYCFAISETVEQYCEAGKEKLEKLSRHTASCILDGEMSIEKAINKCIRRELGLTESSKEAICKSIEQQIEIYKASPPWRMVYR